MPDPVLLCDLGGTHARLGLLQDGQISNMEKFRCAEFDDHLSLFASYNDRHHVQPPSIAVAAAGAHFRDHIPSGFRANSKIGKEMLEDGGYHDPLIMNDFEASAYGAIQYPPQKITLLHAGSPDPSENTQCFIGPGSGLGCAHIHRFGEDIRVRLNFGAHQRPAAATEEQHALILAVQKTQDRAVIYEDFACGRGLHKLYRHVTGRDIAHVDEIFNDRNKPGHQTILRLFHEFLGLYIQDIMISSHSFAGVILHGGLLDYMIEQGVFDFNIVQHMMQQNYVPVVAEAIATTPVSYIGDTFLALYGLKYMLELK